MKIASPRSATLRYTGYLIGSGPRQPETQSMPELTDQAHNLPSLRTTTQPRLPSRRDLIPSSRL
jgi:hypothetical protein